MRQKYRIWDKQENKWFVPTFEANKGHVEELLITPSGEFIMRTLNHQYENVLSHESLFPDRFETVWFTGLKDKNGKEIYEGDIVKQTYHAERGSAHDGTDITFDGHHIGEVVVTASKGVCMRNPLCYSEETGDTERSNQYKSVAGYRCEVIGNIHESPELLQQPTG